MHATRRSPLFSKRPIRVKLLVGLGLLVVMVAILASSGLYSTYAYRNLVKSLSWRVSELPLAAEVNSHVNKLRILLSELRGLRAGPVREGRDELASLRLGMVRERFRGELGEVADAVAEYRKQVEQTMRADFGMADNQPERDAVRKIEVGPRSHRRDQRAIASGSSAMSGSAAWTRSSNGCMCWRPTCPARCTPS